MDRRDFLKLLSASVAVAAAPKFIFDYGKNLYKAQTIESFECEIKLELYGLPVSLEDYFEFYRGDQ